MKGFTDINPMWRIKVLTEVFGAAGIGWWYEITDKRIETNEQTGEAAAFVDITLYYIDPDTGTASRGIPGTGGSGFVVKERNGLYVSDECFKMALTDAIGVAAKALGVAADVYYEKDRSKYDNHLPEEKHKSPQELHFTCKDCGVKLEAYKNDKGETVPIRKHADGSAKKFGRVLCLDCINKVKRNAD